MNELIAKIKKFEEKSGLKLYDEIMDDLNKMHLNLQDVKASREKWRKECLERRKKK